MFLSAKTTLTARSLFSLLVILAASSALNADVFMDLGDVPGGSLNARHPNWIANETIQFAVNRPSEASRDGVTRSTANFSEITLVRRTDVSSADLFVRAANGKVERDAVIELETNGFVHLRIALKQVAVTGYSVAAAPDGTISEQISLSFSEISMTFNVQDPKTGKMTSFTRAWNIAQNLEV